MKWTYGAIIAALAVGGAVLGWTVLPDLLQPSGQHPIECPAAPMPVAASHRFDLTPEDMKLDREKPALILDVAGRALLAWTSQTSQDEYTLFLASSSDRGTTFSAPRAFRKVPIHRYTSMMKGKERLMMTPLQPRLAVLGNTITLSWLEPKDGGALIRLLAARSEDGGQTFAEPVCVHGDAAARPNFTALAAGPDGSSVSVWLDHRNQTQQPFCAVTDRAGQVAAEALVYSQLDGKGVCPCCDLDVIRANDGTIFTAFRNSTGGCRDIYISRSADKTGQAFEPAVSVTAEPWTFDGCPHDGPSLALSQGRLHVMWMDAHTGKRQVYLATSALDKLDFKPSRVSPVVEEEQGHPRVAATDAGVVFAVWEQALPGSPPTDPTQHQHGAKPTGTGRAIMFACSHNHGETFSTPVALTPKEGAFQLHPAVTVGPDGTVLVSWTEVTEDGKSVVVARLSPSATAAQPACCSACDTPACCEVPAKGAARE